MDCPCSMLEAFGCIDERLEGVFLRSTNMETSLLEPVQIWFWYMICYPAEEPALSHSCWAHLFKFKFLAPAYIPIIRDIQNHKSMTGKTHVDIRASYVRRQGHDFTPLWRERIELKFAKSVFVNQWPILELFSIIIVKKISSHSEMFPKKHISNVAICRPVLIVWLWWSLEANLMRWGWQTCRVGDHFVNQ